MNTRQIDVGGITVDVVFKKIKNVHLSVHPPTGRVRISAPRWMNIHDENQLGRTIFTPSYRKIALDRYTKLYTIQMTVLGSKRL